MKPSRAVELALKKQRLQIESERLRREFAGYAQGIEPAFTAVDQARAGWRWLRANPAIPVGILVLMLVARPSVVFRWGRRAWLGWQAWRRLRSRLVADQTLIAP
jgi:hypothetical protein